MSLLIKADGSKWVLRADGTEQQYRFCDRIRRQLTIWWHSRRWQRRQAEFAHTGTRYYGDGGTIHRTTHIDVETRDGRVVSVWFRCQMLPFKQIEVDEERVRDLSGWQLQCELHGVEVRDPKEDI